MMKKQPKYIHAWFLATQPKLPKKQRPKLLDRGRGMLDYDPSRVDLDCFGDNICRIYEEMESKGYEVINVIPINTGEINPCFTATFTQLQNPDYLGNDSYGITRGAVVIGKRRTA